MGTFFIFFTAIRRISFSVAKVKQNKKS